MMERFGEYENLDPNEGGKATSGECIKNNSTDIISSSENEEPFKNEESLKNDENFSYYIISPESINGIRFGYKKSLKDQKIISNLNEKYEGNESSEGLVAKNEQVQLLLSELLGEYENYIKSDLGKLEKRLKEQQEKGNLGEQGEEDTQMVESYEQYLLTNETPEGFEEFLTSTNCINDVISEYLKNHIDDNGVINFISKKDLKAKIKSAWKEKLYKDYIADKQGAKYEELLKLSMMGATVKNRIDKVIHDYLNNGGEKSGSKDLIKGLSDLLEVVRNNENTESFKEKYDKDKINLMLRTSIKEYSRLLNLSDKNRKLQHTDDAVFDLQLRSYLFLYGKIFYPDEFQTNKGLKDSEDQLGELLEAILIVDGDVTKLRKNKFLEKEELLRKEQQERDRIARKDAWDKMVYSLQADNKGPEQDNISIENKNIDIQNASGVEIAKANNLGKGLKEFKHKNEQSDTDLRFMQKIALEETGKQFILENQGILSKYISNGTELIKLFDVNKGVELNSSKWSEFLNTWSKNNPESDISELKPLYDVLLSFRYKFDENLNNLNDNLSNKKDNLHETVKDYAVGAVIDNIKDMFSNIINSNNSGKFMSGFEFDGEESVKIEKDCLMISGHFNGEKVSLKYNLNNGKLYMNAFINQDGNTIIIGSQNPDHEIGSLQPFDQVIDDFYKNPTDSIGDDIFTKFANASIPQPNNESPSSRQHKKEMREKMQEEHRSKIQIICGTKLDEIGGNIKNEVESKSTQYTLVSNLFKTLGILPDNQQELDRTINLTGGSLYKIVQLITTPKNTAEDLNSFSEYMKIIISYIGLDWGRNKDHQDKTKDISKIIFNDENRQDYISYLRENTQNFDNEHSAIQGKAQFDEKSKFGILKIIEEKFTEGEYPNWKLDTNKIKAFADNITKDISIAIDVAAADKLLEENLA